MNSSPSKMPTGPPPKGPGDDGGEGPSFHEEEEDAVAELVTFQKPGGLLQSKYSTQGSETEGSDSREEPTDLDASEQFESLNRKFRQKKDRHEGGAEGSERDDDERRRRRDRSSDPRRSSDRRRRDRRRDRDRDRDRDRGRDDGGRERRRRDRDRDRGRSRRDGDEGGETIDEGTGRGRRADSARRRPGDRSARRREDTTDDNGERPKSSSRHRGDSGKRRKEEKYASERKDEEKPSQTELTVDLEGADSTALEVKDSPKGDGNGEGKEEPLDTRVIDMDYEAPIDKSLSLDSAVFVRPKRPPGGQEGGGRLSHDGQESLQSSEEGNKPNEIPVNIEDLV